MQITIIQFLDTALDIISEIATEVLKIMQDEDIDTEEKEKDDVVKVTDKFLRYGKMLSFLKRLLMA